MPDRFVLAALASSSQPPISPGTRNGVESNYGSGRAIAVAVGVARSTVLLCLTRAFAAGSNWPLLRG
jgi:hypothetical protein